MHREVHSKEQIWIYNYILYIYIYILLCCMHACGLTNIFKAPTLYLCCIIIICMHVVLYIVIINECCKRCTCAVLC